MLEAADELVDELVFRHVICRVHRELLCLFLITRLSLLVDKLRLWPEVLDPLRDDLALALFQEVLAQLTGREALPLGSRRVVGGSAQVHNLAAAELMGRSVLVLRHHSSWRCYHLELPLALQVAVFVQVDSNRCVLEE